MQKNAPTAPTNKAPMPHPMAMTVICPAPMEATTVSMTTKLLQMMRSRVRAAVKKGRENFCLIFLKKKSLGTWEEKRKESKKRVRPATKENEDTRATYFADSRVFQWICAWLLARVSIFICLHSTEHLRKAAAEVEARRLTRPLLLASAAEEEVRNPPARSV